MRKGTIKKREKRARQIKNLEKKRKFAKKLNENLPKSEKWFNALYMPYKSATDEYNVVFGGYIPDVLNRSYKYIIEVDGSIHQLEYIKRKDAKKDIVFKSLGFTVIRIEAYNINSFMQAMEIVTKLKGPYYTPGRTFTDEELKNEVNKLYCKDSGPRKNK